MGTDESDCMVEGPSPVPESDNMVQGSEQEKELMEVVGGLKNEEGHGEVAVNGNEVSSIEHQGLDDDKVVDAVKNSSILETKVSVPTLCDNASQVLGVSGVNGDGFSSIENQGSGDDVVSNGSVLETKVSVPMLSDNVCQVLGVSLVNGDGFSSIENQGLGDCEDVDVVKNNSVLETKVSVLTPSDNDCQVLVEPGMNGDGFSSIENQGLVDDVVKNSSVLDTKVSAPTTRDNDCQVLASSEVNGVSTWLGMQGSDMDSVFSSDGAEKLDYVYASGKLDYMFASESRVAEAAVFRLEGVGKDEGTEDCDEDAVPMVSDSREAEAAILSVDGSEGVGGEETRDENEATIKDCEGNASTIVLESRVAEAAVFFSVAGIVGIDGDDISDGVAVPVVSDSRVANTDVLSVDGSEGVGGEDEKEGTIKDSEGNAITTVLESRVAEASVLSVAGMVGVDGHDIRDGDVVPMVSDSRVADADVLSVDGSELVGGEDERDEKEGTIKDCQGNAVTTVLESRVAEDAVLSVAGRVGVGGGRGEEVEKDEDCGGNVVTIEVRIEETSENMDVEVEGLGDEGYPFAVGTFIWGQVESHPWWPGRIYDPSDASDFALKLKQKNRLLVAYFGNGTFTWCHPSQLKPFWDNFNDMVKQSSSVDFVNAVQEAVNEVGRLLYMKLSHPFVDKKNCSESTFPLVKNSGIKEGVLVPENGIEGLDGEIEPAGLLSYVKLIAQISEFPSIMELEILKAQLSAYYMSKGGYKLPGFMDRQPVPGVEDSLMDETVAVNNSKSTVEAPTQGPFDELGHSPGLSGNIPNPVRKQKSIAEIMGEDRDAHTENKMRDGTVEMVNAIVKKRKGSEDGMASKPVQKKKQLVLATDGDVSSAENDDDGGEENSSKGSLLHSKEKKEAFNEGNSEERNEMGNLSRKRRKSWYLSPPFTTPIKGQSEGSVEAQSLKVSRKARLSQRKAGFVGLSSLPVYMGRLFDSSNYLTPNDDGKKIIDPKKVQAPVEELLSQVRNAAVSPQIRREGPYLDQLVDFTYAFRSSLYFYGSLQKVYNKSQRGGKRKKPESEDEMFEDQNLFDENISSLRQNSGPNKKRRKQTGSGKKGTHENAPGAVLVVSFFPGSTMPSRADLFSVYGKFGALNEAETDMFHSNYTAKVSFLRTSDAENAFKDSQINNPFGSSSDVTFQLQYLSGGSKCGERSKHKPLPPSVSLSQDGEASKLIFIQQKLQGLTLMLEASGDKSADIEREIKALLEDVTKMVEASLF